MTARDYSQMTDDELNREVAERLGWTDIKPFTYMPHEDDDVIETFEGRRPDGYIQIFPDWATDFRAAFELVQTTTYRIAHDKGGEWKTDGDHQTFEEQHWYTVFMGHSSEAFKIRTSLVRALVEAWLTYQDQKSETANTP